MDSMYHTCYFSIFYGHISVFILQIGHRKTYSFVIIFIQFTQIKALCLEPSHNYMVLLLEKHMSHSCSNYYLLFQYSFPMKSGYLH